MKQKACIKCGTFVDIVTFLNQDGLCTVCAAKKIVEEEQERDRFRKGNK